MATVCSRYDPGSNPEFFDEIEFGTAKGATEPNEYHWESSHAEPEGESLRRPKEFFRETNGQQQYG